MSEQVSEGPRVRWRRLKAAPILAICLITLTALLELGLAGPRMF